MRDILDQIRAALDAELYYLALSATLSLPGTCAALESDSGWDTAKKYVAWFDTYITPRYMRDDLPLLSGEDCRQWRNSLLHRGSSQPAEGRYGKYVFVEPVPNANLHRNLINAGTETVLNIDIRVFCIDMVDGVEEWLQVAENTDNYRRNYDRFMRRHPEGLFVGGVEVQLLPGLVFIY